MCRRILSPPGILRSTAGILWGSVGFPTVIAALAAWHTGLVELAEPRTTWARHTVRDEATEATHQASQRSLANAPHQVTAIWKEF